MATKLRYLRKHKGREGPYWRFTPPKDAIRSGVTRSQTFTSRKDAVDHVREQLKIIDEWRRGRFVGKAMASSNLDQIIVNYLHSKRYNSLSENTRKNYANQLARISETPINSKTLGQHKIKAINALICSRAYEFWLDEYNSVAVANELARVFSVVYNYAISLDIVDYNPMVKIQKLSYRPKETVLWTQEQVITFIDTALKDFSTRNVGLIVYMAYEWCQRPVDIRFLKWENINWNERSVKIEQSKKGAVVTLPISDELLHMLEDQKEDFGFQEYVVPNLRPSDGAYRPYNRSELSAKMKKILDRAGLPEELNVGSLRKTGINELIEADVDYLQIMSVTGHRSVGSLDPYVKHRLSSAVKALDKRKAFQSVSK